MNSSLLNSLSQFHFLRPELLILIPLAVAFWLGVQRLSHSSEWLDHIPKEMLAALRVENTTKSSYLRWLWLTVWILVCAAAAGPSWTKQQVPTIQNQNATVILLDLSPSMLAKDLSPDRLTRAKFKLIDILRRKSDGQVALIAYAGDAHTVSPLTDDPKTIEALLPALHPGVMPSRGSNTEAAVSLAQKLLTDAGLVSGEILLITDGVSDTAKAVIRNELATGNSVSILAVGSNEAAPIPAGNGGFIRNSRGEIVLSKVKPGELRALARQLNGRFAKLSDNDSDLDKLLSNNFERSENESNKPSNEFDAWADAGHWLVLLILPMFLVFFRKGLIYCLPILFFMPLQSDAADAWSKLWKTPDQQAAQLFEEQQYEAASERFARQDWSAVADYKDGDYENAANKLEGKQDVTSLYNKGNALAMAGELKKAIEAYDAALAKQANHHDSLHNKELLEKLLEQQQKQEQNQDKSKDDKESSDQQQDSENQKSESNSEDSQSQESKSKQSDSEAQPQDGEEGEKSDGEPSANEEPSADQEPSADEESSTDQEPSANKEPSADREPSNENESADEQKESSVQDAQDSKTNEDQEPDTQVAQTQLEDSPEQLKNSSEKWLRGIKEDPSGLLRRKFQYQNRLREQQGLQRSKTGDQERY